MFSAKCTSTGFSRFACATTTYVAHGLKGSPAVIIPALETVEGPPATLTNRSLAKITPTGKLVATTKLFGEKKE